jgi:CheY-like chemotaxis protein
MPNSSSCSRVCSPWTVRVMAASRARDVLTRLAELRPDASRFDIDMPGMDGGSLARPCVNGRPGVDYPVPQCVMISSRAKRATTRWVAGRWCRRRPSRSSCTAIEQSSNRRRKPRAGRRLMGAHILLVDDDPGHDLARSVLVAAGHGVDAGDGREGASVARSPISWSPMCGCPGGRLGCPVVRSHPRTALVPIIFDALDSRTTPFGFRSARTTTCPRAACGPRATVHRVMSRRTSSGDGRSRS